ncbi:MAG: PQQ-dependent sugar dehydrogenase [Pirellulales bacterium]|nr:PQQ-dependent sugar dehydrogenase [Pirellulales bacterium]
MKPDYLITFGTMAALVWACGSLFALVSLPLERQKGLILYCVLSFGALLGMLAVDADASLGRNAAVHLISKLRNGSFEHLCLAALGVCVGFGAAAWPWQQPWAEPLRGIAQRLLRSLQLLSILGTIGCIALLALQDRLKPYLVHRSLTSIASEPFGIKVPEGFLCEEFHQCADSPVQIAVGPEGNLFATAYSGVANQYGVVLKLTADVSTGRVQETTVARHLNRPHGLAFWEGELYVSRSGQYARAIAGRLVHENTGAITLLRDTDGDGLMDYYQDVVTDLPGAQGPDELHQNNGIAFSDGGNLYITSGAHADRGPTTHPYEGTILSARPDGSELTVYAEGFRNPFDVVVGAGGEVFCTDNDANDRRSGDEFNHVMQGKHYGFPYADGQQEHPTGTIAPLLVAYPGTLQGLTYTEAEGLPKAYRNCFYSVSYGNGEIWRMRLQGEPGSYTVEKDLFARIPQALDIAIAEDGTIYVSCFGSKKIYRVRLREDVQ